MSKYNFVIVSLVFFNLFAVAQKQPGPLFKNGDRVCFVGNSITNNGEFYNFIYLYYATRFPAEKLRFYNCGISGDECEAVLKRMDADILMHKPTWSVLMIGMNDVKRSLYTPAAAKKTDILMLRNNALDTYRDRSEQVIQKLAANSKLIIQKPTIYDQTAALKAENAYGVNEALKKGAEHMQSMSAKYRARLVDYQTIMQQVNKEVQEKDSTATIIGPDRIHPGTPGHLLMAYQFLKDTGAPAYVSKIVIDSNLNRSRNLSINCEVTGLVSANAGLQFNCLENSLPFPVRPEASETLTLVPFITELNQEILQVNILKPGNYELCIDTVSAGVYSAEELEAGINLSLNKSTPQYKQALDVMKFCMAYRSNESLLRSLKFVEYGQLANLKAGIDTATIRSFLDSRLENYRAGGHYSYYQTQFKNYLVNKPKETATRQKLEDLADRIYTVNKPVVHVFRIIKKG